uniref:Uncharacterized protein n=1 Tax=Ditylenchus dipsaci TaxID=166011 RepID=A0A915E0Z2_9BILA
MPNVDHENNFVNRPVIDPIALHRLEKDLDEVGRHAAQPSATIYNYKWEPKRIVPCSQILMSNDLDDDGLSSERTRYIDAHYAGNSTIYGEDDWSSNAGTCLKQSKLIRQSDILDECLRKKTQPFSHSTTPINQWLQKLHSSHK